MIKYNSSQKDYTSTILGLSGIDLVTPVDMLKTGKSPYAKNFRLYAQQSDSRKVAVSSRKGNGYFMDAFGQTVEYAQGSSDGASTATVGIMEGVHGVKFQAVSSNCITRVDVRPSDPSGKVSGTLLVEIWSDNNGLPYKKLAISSIESGAIGTTSAWLPARFVNAIKLSQSSYYWIILRMQDDSVGAYTLDTTTAYACYKTDSTINNLSIQTYGINIKIYGTPEGTFRGSHRYVRDNGSNTTVAAYGSTMYYFDDYNTMHPIITGLNKNAQIYRFAHADNKVFWVNGYDTMTTWDGSFETSNPNIVSNGSFNVDTGGWSARNSSTISRDTTVFMSTPASLKVSGGTNSIGSALHSITMSKNHRYKISFYAKRNSGSGNVYVSDYTNNSAIGPATNISTVWAKVEFYFMPTNDILSIGLDGSTATPYYIDDVAIVDTGVSYIIDPELEIASDIIFSKERLWTKVANNPNKMQWCEEPGNPTYKTVNGVQVATSASEQWYNSWRSVDYIYIPRPHAGSPVVSFVDFQNAIIFFTQDKKYVVDGYDKGSYTMREANGSSGALSNKSVAVDENNIWFVSKDGFYKYNGSSDAKISVPISPIFDACPNKDEIRPVVWKNQVRFYMASSGSSYNNICMIYDKDLDEWMMDTDVYVKDALWLNDANDSQDLLEFSSIVPQVFVADVYYNNLGAPIDFEYRLPYNSMQSPGQKKRIKRFVPLLQGVDTSFPLIIEMDKDFQDSPRAKIVNLKVNGAVLGDFALGDGTILGGNKSFKPKRQSYSGYAYYWQPRIIRNAVNNRVAFIGAQYEYKTKRL